MKEATIPATAVEDTAGRQVCADTGARQATCPFETASIEEYPVPGAGRPTENPGDALPEHDTGTAEAHHGESLPGEPTPPAASDVEARPEREAKEPGDRQPSDGDGLGGWDHDNLGIDILVDTVREGRMDPWDLDIIEVTDRYLEKIDTMDHRQLTVSGRLFFYASVLLRLKAEFTAKGFLQLSRSFRDDDETVPDAELDACEYEFHCPFDESDGEAASGEQLHLPGMIMIPRPTPERRRGLSLQDLIAALQRCEDLERRRERARKAAARRVRQHREVVETAHGDDLGGDIVRMRNKVGDWPVDQDYRVHFDELLCEHLSPTTAYMALLFLAAESEVSLHQERFYQDLYVSRAVPGPTADEVEDDGSETEPVSGVPAHGDTEGPRE